MKEIKRDLFDCISDPMVNAICITTNSQYTEDGRACMGGGSARQCADRWPETAFRLGKCLKNFQTNVPFIIGMLNERGEYLEPNLKKIKERKFKCLIFSFPTIDDLMDGAKIELIQRSAEEMKIFADRFQLMGVAGVRFGSGIGGLDWYRDVKPVVEKILDDRFIICCQENDELR
jgi:hypothetical protein